eukprot:m.62787 g.62787  ORF g.62787 m.62787 type:complete len:174 (+) comp7419_c0_seq4:1508-2029(+)
MEPSALDTKTWGTTGSGLLGILSGALNVRLLEDVTESKIDEIVAQLAAMGVEPQAAVTASIESRSVGGITCFSFRPQSCSHTSPHPLTAMHRAATGEYERHAQWRVGVSKFSQVYSVLLLHDLADNCAARSTKVSRFCADCALSWIFNHSSPLQITKPLRGIATKLSVNCVRP